MSVRTIETDYLVIGSRRIRSYVSTNRRRTTASTHCPSAARRLTPTDRTAACTSAPAPGRSAATSLGSCSSDSCRRGASAGSRCRAGSASRFLAPRRRRRAERHPSDDLFARLEASEQLLRVDTRITPTMFRGPTLSTDEVEQLRRIGDVVASLERLSAELPAVP